MESREQAESAAAAWIARRERGSWNANDEAELAAWIAASTDHRVAWLRLDTAWQQTARLKTLKTQVSQGAVPTREQSAIPFFSGNGDITEGSPARGARRWVGIAAAVVGVASVLGSYLYTRSPSYETAVGVLQAVPLADGSRVTLNTDTRIDVELTEETRRVNLTHGEAYFEVAKDPARPFVVTAGNQRVVVLGTQFSVRRDSADIRVLVTEGKVEIEDRSAGNRRATQLEAGNMAEAGGAGVVVQKKPLQEMEQFLRWRSGYLVFDRTPLAQAAAEFNRYSKRRIVIDDPVVAAIRVGGSFRASNVEGFVRLIQSDFPIVATERPDRIILTGVPRPTK